ncbi:MAG: hypothetical protein EI684_18015 [Candidatus Viridilinea halotolerans]|uniref:Uncharacterized protein n=1 Tax=Candidatus Viridilinea halotolerans TaxID=2491704 RepID=A0A426TTL0_9CHLR|nr:MAG: hypothetical protein EI684_18015 [Candidatus Viridilinea halotolerans]
MATAEMLSFDELVRLFGSTYRTNKHDAIAKDPRYAAIIPVVHAHVCAARMGMSVEAYLAWNNERPHALPAPAPAPTRSPLPLRPSRRPWWLRFFLVMSGE